MSRCVKVNTMLLTHTTDKGDVCSTQASRRLVLESCSVADSVLEQLLALAEENSVFWEMP